MKDIPSVLERVGYQLSEYLKRRVSFAELEDALAEAKRSDPERSELYRGVYHIVNHYEIDERSPSAAKTPGNSMTTGAVEALADALKSGSITSTEGAIASYWTYPGAGK